MARDKKTEPFEGIDTDSLPTLTPQEFDFVHYLMFDKEIDGNASEAYRRAFPGLSHKDNTVWCEASKLKGSSRVRQWITCLTINQMHRLEGSREQYLANIQADIAEAKAAGNYGAAATLRAIEGKVTGYVVERTENINQTNDQILSLKNIAKSAGKDKALELASMIGQRDALEKALASEQPQGNA